MSDAGTRRGAQLRGLRDPANAEARCSARPGKRRPLRSRLRSTSAGLFTWAEWATTLGDEIKRAQAAGDPDTGETYYHHWLAALERLVAEKRLAEPALLARTRDAWRHAAARTPHGTPIELRPEDFRS